MSFVHLHVHTEFSLLDGACRIRDLPGIVKAMGQTACAVTDTASCTVPWTFTAPARRRGSSYHRLRGVRHPPGPDPVRQGPRAGRGEPPSGAALRERGGLPEPVLPGVHGLDRGFYIKPRIDLELLRQYSGGLIALSACLAGEIPRGCGTGSTRTPRPMPWSSPTSSARTASIWSSRTTASGTRPS